MMRPRVSQRPFQPHLVWKSSTLRLGDLWRVKGLTSSILSTGAALCWRGGWQARQPCWPEPGLLFSGMVDPFILVVCLNSLLPKRQASDRSEFLRSVALSNFPGQIALGPAPSLLYSRVWSRGLGLCRRQGGYTTLSPLAFLRVFPDLRRPGLNPIDPEILASPKQPPASQTPSQPFLPPSSSSKFCGFL